VWRIGVVLTRWEEAERDRRDRFVADRVCIVASIEEDQGMERRMMGGQVGRWVLTVALVGALFRSLKDRLVVGWTWINNLRGWGVFTNGCSWKTLEKLLRSACESRRKILNEEEWIYPCYYRISRETLIEEMFQDVMILSYQQKPPFIERRSSSIVAASSSTLTSIFPEREHHAIKTERNDRIPMAIPIPRMRRSLGVDGSFRFHERLTKKQWVPKESSVACMIHP
jgi:hypothetical protein